MRILRSRAATTFAAAFFVLACSDDGPSPFDGDESLEGQADIHVTAAVAPYASNPRYHTLDGAPRVLLGGSSNVTPGNRSAVDKVVANQGNYARVWHNFIIPPAAWRKLSTGKYDLMQWNETYWSQLRDVVGYAKSKKVILSVMLFSEPGLEARSDRWAVHPFHPNNNVNALGLPSIDGVPEFYRLGNGKLRSIQEAYVDRLVREIAPYGNVIFEIANEYTGPGDWEAHFINFVQARTNAPIAVNRLGNPSTALTLPGVDQANYHNLHDGQVFTTFAGNYHRGRAQHYDEQALGSQSTAELRSMAWEAVLGGGGLNWDQSGNPSETPAITRGVATFLTNHAVQPWKFVPSTLAGSSRPAMQRGTEELVVYVASGGATVNLAGWSGTYSVRWYNPVTRSSVTNASITGGGSRSLAAPFAAGVLHLKRSSGGSPVPSLTIAITGITPGATLTGPTKVTASVTSSAAVQRVAFYLDGNLVRTEYYAPYSLASASSGETIAFDFEARGYRSGAHVLKVLVTARASDGSTFTSSRQVSFYLSL